VIFAKLAGLLGVWMKRSARQSELLIAALLFATALSCLEVRASGSASSAASLPAAPSSPPSTFVPQLPPPVPGRAADAPAVLGVPGTMSVSPAAQRGTSSGLSTAAAPAALGSNAPFASHAEQAALVLGVLQNLKPVGWTSADTLVYSAPIAAAPSAGPHDMVASLLQDPAAPQQPAAQSGLSIDRLSSEMDAQKVAMLQEFGCTSVFSRSFQRGQRRLTVRIFQFASSEGAFGAYSLLRQGATTVVQRGDASSEDEQSISFWQGRCFISVSGTSQDDDESKNLVRDIADKVSAVMREHAPLPAILQRLPQFERVRASERIVMGPQSTRRFFPAPYLQSVDFSRSRGAAIADYQIQAPPDRLKLLLIEYPTPQAALTAYYRYTGNFEEHTVEVAAPFGGAASVYRVNKNFLLCQTRGSELVIITGARKRESAMFLARYMF
jgi:hypothetical protein